jgi:hypothetical protein
MDIGREYVDGKGLRLDLDDQLELVDKLNLPTNAIETTETRMPNLPIDGYEGNVNELHKPKRVRKDESLQQLRMDFSHDPRE